MNPTFLSFSSLTESFQQYLTQVLTSRDIQTPQTPQTPQTLISREIHERFQMLSRIHLPVVSSSNLSTRGRIPNISHERFQMLSRIHLPVVTSSSNLSTRGRIPNISVDTTLTKIKNAITNKTHLHLQNSSIQALPESIGELTNLEQIRLHNIKITSLPDSIGKLKNLQRLFLSHTQINSLPESLGQLQNLKELDLTYSPIISLPQPFGKLKNLQRLDLYHTQLNSLPESLGQLQNLKELDLSDSPIISLPQSFGKLKNLQRLNLSHTQLNSLPESLDQLQNLRKLFLINSRITTLPNSIVGLNNLEFINLDFSQLTSLPESFGQLQNLKELHLSRSQITTLPNSIGGLKNLELINLDFSQLTSLPESFGQLQNLKELNLSRSQITTLPNSIGQLQKLKNLYLRNIRTLSSLPIETLDLSHNCSIDLIGSSLSLPILERMLEVTNTEDYNGPRVHISIADRKDNERKSIEELLTTLYNLIEKPFNSLTSLDKNETLHSWLSRLSDVADYKKSTSKKPFANAIIKYLEKADEDPKFRELFYMIIQDASETCGDRVALSIVHLGVSYKLTTLDLHNLQELADFLLRSVWVVDMLESIARNKIPTLPLVDEIEVYLGYLIQLKDTFNMSIDIENMLYFSCSGLKSTDIQYAKEHVSLRLMNQEARIEFLVKNDKWKEALSINYPKEIKSIEYNRSTSAESATTSEDWVKIDQEYMEALINITKTALQS